MQRRTLLCTILFIVLLPVVCLAANNRSASHDKVVKPQISNAASPLSGKTIVIDPGHGGSDSGAIGKSGLMEKEVTLAISSELQKILTGMKAKVIMTRTADHDVHSREASDVQELQARVNVANGSRANLFISVHIDSFTDPTARGTTTYYFSKSAKDKQLAKQIQAELVGHIGLPDRGWQQNDFYVLRHTVMPAVLAEVAFISNPAEEAKLKQTAFIQQAARGIAAGIVKYFTTASKTE